MGGILLEVALPLAFYCFIICLLLVISAFVFHFSSLWKELFLISSIVGCGLVISAPVSTSSDLSQIYEIKGRCEEVLPHNNYIVSIQHQFYYLSHYYADTTYQIGDSLNFYAYIRPLQNNANPEEFSYTQYLKQKNVFSRFMPITSVQKNGQSDNVYTYFDRLRKKLLEKTERLLPDTNCRRLVNALCLGYKNDLDSELENLFISTGTIHLLSVSGLHTGAIYLFILFFFKRLGFSHKKTSLIVLPVLWCYACLTGLSPSVVRAATILSFINIGEYFNKSYTPLNSVAAAAFITLLIHPSSLYSLSFLLSYSAYTGILTIYPFLYQFSGKLPSLLAKIYACCCITLAAQLPTLPISAYYFHTINLNGFLANIIAVPLATLLLYCSIICLLLPFIVSHYFILVPEILGKMLIGFLRIFEPISLNLKNLYPSFLTVILLYLCLIFFCLYIFQPNKIRLRYSIFSFCALLLWSLCFQLHLTRKQELVVFHIYQKSAILLNYKGYYTFLYQTSDSLPQTIPYIRKNKLRSLLTHQGIIHSKFDYYDHQLITLKDTITIIQPSHFHRNISPILIVTHNLPPERVFAPEPNCIFPQKIILDGSNSSSIIQRWEFFCRQNHLLFYSTAESGSLCITLP